MSKKTSTKEVQILQIVCSRAQRQERNPQSSRAIKYKDKDSVPMTSVKLIHPQQPSDTVYQDILQTPDDNKQLYDSMAQSGERISGVNEEMPQEKYSYSIDTKCFKKTNTEVYFNDSLGNYFRSIKLFFTEKTSKQPIGTLIQNLLSDEVKGEKITRQNLSQNNSFCFDDIFENLILLTHITILLLNPVLLILDQGSYQLSIQSLQIVLLSINLIIKMQLLQVTYCKQESKIKYCSFTIFFIMIQLILLILYQALTIFESDAELVIITLLLLNMITIQQLSKWHQLFHYEKIIKLTLCSFQLCHLFSCLFIKLDIATFYNLNTKDQIREYIFNYSKFCGYLMGLGSESNENEGIFYYMLLIMSLVILWILKIQLFQEFYLHASNLQNQYIEEHNIVECCSFLKSGQFQLLNIKKLCRQIQEQIKQQKEIKRIKDQNQLINCFSFKESIKTQILYQDKLQQLLSLGLFQKISHQSLTHIINLIDIRYFKNDEIIIQQNISDDGSIFIIKKGRVKVYFHNELRKRGQKFVELHENQCFGQFSFLTGQPRSATVKSEGECCVLKLSNQNFFSSIKNNLDDIEIVNQIKDEIIQKNQLDLLDLSCFNCRASNHLIQNCPQLHLQLNKERIVMELLQPVTQRRRQFQRIKQKHGDARISLQYTQVKCQELQDDLGYASSLGETDHTNYQQNQSHQTYTQQSSINYPSKSLGGQNKILLRPSTFENTPSIDIQESMKEQQFREIDQLFVRTSNPKATTSTAGFGQKETNSQKNPQQEANNTISEQQSEDSSGSDSSFQEDDISANSRNTKLKPLRQSTHRSDKSQFRSGVSSISMNYTPKPSQLSILNTFTQKSDLNNNVQSNSNMTSQKNLTLSPLNLNQKEERSNTLVIPQGNNLLQLPPKKSLMNPISQLNYEVSPFVAHSQYLTLNDSLWSSIEMDRQQNYRIYYPNYNIQEVLQRYRSYQQGLQKNVGLNNVSDFTKYNTL